MKRALALMIFLAACSRTKEPTADTADSAAPCGTLGGSCSKEGESCSPAPIGTGWSHMLTCRSGKWTEMEIAPLPTPAGSAQAAPRSLPKLDQTCNTDADCTTTSEEIVDDPPRTYACCSGCTSHAVSTAWLKSFQAACAQNPAPMCPPIGCAMAIVTAKCTSHRCEVAKTKP